MVKSGWIPPVSPYGLLQESLWPNEWAILVGCMMLNCTSRKQVEKVLPTFLSLWPDPGSLISAKDEDVVKVISSLGFGNRRTKGLKMMSMAYREGDWTHVNQLPGIGEYASAAWEIFCRGTVRPEPPKDHALVKYWSWFQRNFGGKN